MKWTELVWNIFWTGVVAALMYFVWGFGVWAFVGGILLLAIGMKDD